MTKKTLSNSNNLINQKRFSAIEEYINNNYFEEDLILEVYELQDIIYENSIDDLKAPTIAPRKKRSLEDVLGEIEESFGEMLFRLIDEKEITDVEAYKGANIDRRIFSKIRSEKDYKPSKRTAISFAISLKLNHDQACDLLSRAGYALSPSNKFDLIIEYFIKEENYDLFEINEALLHFDQPLLGV